MISEIKFIFKHRKDLLFLLKEINEVRSAVHAANRDSKLDKAELRDILKEADDVLEKIIDILEE